MRLNCVNFTMTFNNKVFNTNFKVPKGLLEFASRFTYLRSELAMEIFQNILAENVRKWQN